MYNIQLKIKISTTGGGKRFIFTPSPDRARRPPTSLPRHWITEAVFQGIRKTGNKTDHSTSSSTDVKSARSHTSAHNVSA
jgi:hypothetical protein